MTDRAEELLTEAKRLLDLADTCSWEATEAIWRAHVEEGVSRRQIGRRIGRHPRTVGRHIELWETHGPDAAPRQSFIEAYAALPGSSPADRGRRETKKFIQSADDDVVANRLALWAELDEHQAAVILDEFLSARAARWNAEAAERRAEADADRKLEVEMPNEEAIREAEHYKQMGVVWAGLRQLRCGARIVAEKWVEVREGASDEERDAIAESARETGDTIVISLAVLTSFDSDDWILAS